jgi:hypothetical protein
MEPRITLDVIELVIYSVALLLYIVMVTKISRWNALGYAWIALLMLCLMRIGWFPCLTPYLSLIFVNG